jgi:hypothetical protein
VQPFHLSLPFPGYLVQRLRRGYLSCRLAGRSMGPNVNRPRSTGRTAEAAPDVRKRRFSGIAGQQGHHRHDRVVVAVQARDVEFAGIGRRIPYIWKSRYLKAGMMRNSAIIPPMHHVSILSLRSASASQRRQHLTVGIGTNVLNFSRYIKIC